MTARAGDPLRVVLTGPECTGKSTLTAHLACRFGIPSAMEYARMVLEARGPAYDYGLLAEMARDLEVGRREIAGLKAYEA